MARKINVAVSGIPRGYQRPIANGNWLTCEHKEKILAVSPKIELIEIPANQVSSSELNNIEVVLAEGGNYIHYPGELDQADYQAFFTPTLKWIQLCSTGFSDNIMPQVVNKQVILTNAPGLHTTPIAESVLAAMLQHAKNFRQRRADQEMHSWNQLKNDELYGRTVLIVGLGKIGKQVARLCRAFNMKVIGTKRLIEPVDNVHTVFANTELCDYLPLADYVVLCVPLTKESEDLLGEREFAAMKSTCYLINVGRGKVASQEVMLRYLREGKIAGAYLDAFAIEPLPEDHELWGYENVFIVPHDSHSSPYIGDRMVDIFCHNLGRYVDGQVLDHICDPKRGY